MLTEQDELGIYHVLRLRGRIRHIKLTLPASILHNVLVIMDETFPILEHLALSRSFSLHHPPLTLPKGFLAPNLLHLTLSNIGLSKRLRVFTSTVSLVTLTLSVIQSYGDFRPRLLVARLRSLPLLEELTITFSIPIPRPGTERELLGEIGAPITLPCLNFLWFHGAGGYLESLVTQIRVPLLERLSINLCNQIAFTPPHVSYLTNITKVFKFSSATVMFYHKEVLVIMDHDHGVVSVCVSCPPLRQQIDVAARICDALIPTLSDVEKLALLFGNEQEPGYIIAKSAMWHDFLRRFIGVKLLCTDNVLFKGLSQALQVDKVRSDPGFLPNLQDVNVKGTLLSTRQVVGSPVQFLQG